MDTPKIIVHDKVDDSDMVAINMGEEADFPSMIPEEEELSIRVKKSRADRKKGVEMRMMFRDHHDPLYYDAKANDKCFVPVMAMEEMTEEQRRIVESFPKEDRGEINPNSTDAADFEDDFVVAHVKRGLARQIEMKERRAERRDMLGEYGNEEEDEDEYLDSEEEYKCELDFRAQSKKEHWEEKEQN